MYIYIYIYIRMYQSAVHGVTAQQTADQMRIEIEPSIQIERAARVAAGLPVVWTHGSWCV